MLRSEIEISSLSHPPHPLSPYYLSSSPLRPSFSSTSHTSLSIYLPVSICISPSLPLTLPFSLLDSMPSVWSMEFILFRKFSCDGFFSSAVLCLHCIFIYFVSRDVICFCGWKHRMKQKQTDVLMRFIKHLTVFRHVVELLAAHGCVKAVVDILYLLLCTWNSFALNSAWGIYNE